jgi:hypothetical protein
MSDSGKAGSRPGRPKRKRRARVRLGGTSQSSFASTSMSDAIANAQRKHKKPTDASKKDSDTDQPKE